MKVLLIQPPYTILNVEPKGAQPPLGLAYLGGVLEKDHQVRILDALAEGYHIEEKVSPDSFRYGLSFDLIKKFIAAWKPDIVGISCLFTTQSENAHRVASLVREVSENIITVMGGAHPSSLPLKVMEDPSVDYIIIGEGEESFKDLINKLTLGDDVSGVDGLVYRKDGKILINPKTRFIEDLDSIPFPARHLLDMKKYFKINTPMGNLNRRKPNTPLITSRGCPANCIFCSIHTVWGRKFRARSVDNIMAELRHLKNDYGVRELQFCDDNITMNRERARRLFQRMIDEKLDLLWTAPNGMAIWSMDEDLLEKIRGSGCYKISIAIESGVERVLREVIKKPLDLEKIKPLVRKIRKLRMGMDVYFVVGLPGERREEIEETLRFALDMRADNLSISIATPHPGTEMWEICREKGYIENLDYKNIRGRLSNIPIEGLSREEFNRMLSRANLISRLRVIFRNPFTFYERVIRRFFLDPRFFYHLSRKTFTDLILRIKA